MANTLQHPLPLNTIVQFHIVNDNSGIGIITAVSKDVDQENHYFYRIHKIKGDFVQESTIRANNPKGELWINSDCEVDNINKELITFKVLYEDCNGDRWYFQCQAENESHAIEQALNESTVLRVIKVE